MILSITVENVCVVCKLLQEPAVLLAELLQTHICYRSCSSQITYPYSSCGFRVGTSYDIPPNMCGHSGPVIVLPFKWKTSWVGTSYDIPPNMCGHSGPVIVLPFKWKTS